MEKLCVSDYFSNVEYIARVLLYSSHTNLSRKGTTLAQKGTTVTSQAFGAVQSLPEAARKSTTLALKYSNGPLTGPGLGQ